MLAAVIVTSDPGDGDEGPGAPGVGRPGGGGHRHRGDHHARRHYVDDARDADILGGADQRSWGGTWILKAEEGEWYQPWCLLGLLRLQAFNIRGKR